MGFGPDGHETVEMMHVDMHENAIEAREDLLADALEVLGEGNVRRDRENCLVIDLALYPVHQIADVPINGSSSFKISSISLAVVRPVIPPI